MLDNVAADLQTGTPMSVETVEAENLPEGIYAAGLAAIAKDHDTVSIGSYPSFTAAGFRNQIVIRGRDMARVGAAGRAVRDLVARLQAERSST